ncbi:PP2C family protein-serine/threonine phosphatase [Pseudonocardia humida]|uniref:Serine/threonine-protein phosphatase n=1 Tax=Pseudonocardia humida TaxID=2800819 RepID=A0ABT1A0A4_9PSEU|nr:GAF domain-containing SpoIIE family protein phosphatase [Pseudonocardia humida]MCO1656309.1 serine/threonine-protein phosphatase [Pseudonocardia humida]
MPEHRGSGPDLRALLEKVESASPVQAVEVVADELGAVFGARAVSFLIADFSGRAVFRMGRAREGASGTRFPGAEQVHLPGTVYERVLITQHVDVREVGDGAQLTVPVTDRGDAIGLIELDLPYHPDEARVADIAAAGHALAYIVVASRQHTDLFEWGQRSIPFTLAAEIQRRLLPSAFTCEAGQFTIAGWLEPASSVGGDTFDYSLDQHSLQVSITDAAGHDVAAALLATVLVGSLRNERRRGADLGEQLRNANDALVAHSRVGQFVTGQVMHIDLDGGTATIVNAGHPFPLLLRRGRVEEIALEIDPPFGLQAGWSFRLQRFALEPGDRIVFVTDGMLEREAARCDLPAAIAGSGELHPRQVVHALGAEVLLATGGSLRDDATTVCLDWYGGSPRPRISAGGATTEPGVVVT